MNAHPTQEQMSAFIDGETAAPDRDRLKAHFESCPGCAALKARLEHAVVALTALDLPEPTADQHRALRQAILDRPVRRRFFFAHPAFVGSLAVASLAAVAVVTLRPKPVEKASTVAQGGLAARIESFDFASDTDIRSSVAGLPEVTEARFTAEDVGVKQEEAYSAALGSSEAGASKAAESGTDQAAPQQETSRAAGAGADPQVAGSNCSRKILRTQPYPMIPLLIRSATYKKQPAWLLVYAWTASQARNAPLNQIQVWLVDPAKCADLTGDDLINATYHYSSFKRT